jgi:spoIIIJ-associated protein
MEWVETTARTVEEAKDLALDQLGVDETDAEFEIVEEPRPGLFGRMRGEARVRARVRPTRPRPKVERRDRRKRGGKDDGTTEAEAAAGAVVAVADPDPESGEPTDESAAGNDKRRRQSGGAAPANEVEAASEFLRGLTDALSVHATIEVEPSEDETEIRLLGEDLGLLIGPRGQTLVAVQELTRLAVTHREGDRQGRLRIDIAGYRERRRQALMRFTEQVAEQVRATGAPRALEPMNAADRKVVHDAANGIAGVTTTSEGEDPHRHVVILPEA